MAGWSGIDDDYIFFGTRKQEILVEKRPDVAE
jgi:hypothetical protein